jgi:hypothetical protein
VAVVDLQGEGGVTPGQEALAEAARLEAAAFYGRAAGDTSNASRQAARAADEAAYKAAVRRQSRHRPPDMAKRAEAEIEQAWYGTDPIPDAIKAGLTTTQIMAKYGATYREVREARKRVMGGAA